MVVLVLGTSCAQCVAVTVLYSCGRDLWQMNLICSGRELSVVPLEGPKAAPDLQSSQDSLFRTSAISEISLCNV